MSQKVWPVMSCDSDERPIVVALFSTEELQKECLSMCKGDFWLGDPIEVDSVIPKMRDGLSYFEMELERDRVCVVTDKGLAPSSNAYHYVISYAPVWWPYPSRLKIGLRAKSEDEAVALAKKKRDEIIASGEWPDDGGDG